MTTTARSAAGALFSLAVLLSGTGVRAQEVEDQHVRFPVYIRGVEIRMPSEMHTGPIRLVGMEQGDNGFRHRTPALERSDRVAAEVDHTELYRRRIAMYAGEQPDLDDPGEESAVHPGAATPEAEPPPRPSPRRGVGLAMMCTVGFVLVLIWWARRRPSRA